MNDWLTAKIRRLTPAETLELNRCSPNLPGPEAIFFMQPTGSIGADFESDYRREDWASVKSNGNWVNSRPHDIPQGAGASLQSALLSSLQPCRTFKVPDPRDASVSMTRCATRFVHLAIWIPPDKGHAVVLDLGDGSTGMGVFDPNFGWMEPKQGFNVLSMEQVLMCLWEFYTNVKCERPRTKGREFLDFFNNSFARIEAYQIYLQTLNYPGKT